MEMGGNKVEAQQDPAWAHKALLVVKCGLRTIFEKVFYFLPTICVWAVIMEVK
jgi:hypothetical protein